MIFGTKLMSTLVIEEFKNYKDFTLGIDLPPKDSDPKEYLKTRVYYNYNSRGFRDKEWPDKLDNVVWCIGDSFTTGVGQPQNETWPAVLESKTDIRTINLGEDGCSNDTICLRAVEVYQKYKPKNIVIMWSYLHRRRENGKNVHHSKISFGDQEDIDNFKTNFDKANALNTNIINLIIPTSQSKHVQNKMLNYQVLDYARDQYHFGPMTSQAVGSLVQQHLLTS